MSNVHDLNKALIPGRHLLSRLAFISHHLLLHLSLYSFSATSHTGKSCVLVAYAWWREYVAFIVVRLFPFSQALESVNPKAARYIGLCQCHFIQNVVLRNLPFGQSTVVAHFFAQTIDRPKYQITLCAVNAERLPNRSKHLVNIVQASHAVPVMLASPRASARLTICVKRRI